MDHELSSENGEELPRVRVEDVMINIETWTGMRLTHYTEILLLLLLLPQLGRTVSLTLPDVIHLTRAKGRIRESCVQCVSVVLCHPALLRKGPTWKHAS